MQADLLRGEEGEELDDDDDDDLLLSGDEQPGSDVFEMSQGGVAPRPLHSPIRSCGPYFDWSTDLPSALPPTRTRSSSPGEDEEILGMDWNSEGENGQSGKKRATLVAMGSPRRGAPKEVGGARQRSYGGELTDWEMCTLAEDQDDSEQAVPSSSPRTPTCATPDLSLVSRPLLHHPLYSTTPLFSQRTFLPSPSDYDPSPTHFHDRTNLLDLNSSDDDFPLLHSPPPASPRPFAPLSSLATPLPKRVEERSFDLLPGSSEGAATPQTASPRKIVVKRVATEEPSTEGKKGSKDGKKERSKGLDRGRGPRAGTTQDDVQPAKRRKKAKVSATVSELVPPRNFFESLPPSPSPTPPSISRTLSQLPALNLSLPPPTLKSLLPPTLEPFSPPHSLEASAALSLFLPNPPSPTPIHAARSALSHDPTQAEMDAFFGYIDPYKAVEVVLPSSSSPPPVAIAQVTIQVPAIEQATRPEIKEGEEQRRFTREEKSKENAIEDALPKDAQPPVVPTLKDAAASVAPAAEVYQLQPVPSISPATRILMTADERRLAIIHCLELLTLSILTRLVTSTSPALVSPPLIDDDGSDSTPTDSQKKKPKSKKVKKLPPQKPPRIVIRLAKRVGGNFDPTASPSAPRAAKTLVFPRKLGKGKQVRCGGRELAAFVKAIELILEGLKSNVVVTKRDLYYRAVKLFVRQSIVDSIVEDIAATLQVRRADLNVVAASKGLFGGALKILGKDGVLLEGGSQGALIPPTQLIDHIDCPNISWVLIIEKEAVFHSLCCPSFLSLPSLGSGILLTGKGYPDLATRELVKRLSLDLPMVPILCLVDSDPHGLEILSTYKFGSAALAFDKENLAVDRVEWLGVKGSEWDSMGVGRKELLGLSKGDRRKALAMMRREWVPDEWKRELAIMLHRQKKAEIQVLSSTRGNGEAAGARGSRLFEYVAQGIGRHVGAGRA